ncbi:MAG: monovalent cation/H+ antiporter complex subunit F [Microbacterium sp.]
MIISILVTAIAVVFATGAVLTIIRMVKGPSILDRALASDVLLTMVLCLLGAEAAINRRTDTLPIMLMIAATGVLGTVAVARFVARREGRDGRETRGPSDRVPGDSGEAEQ